MKAIVYTSHTGHTQRYAQLLAERTGVPAYSMKEAREKLLGVLLAAAAALLCAAIDYVIKQEDEEP